MEKFIQKNYFQCRRLRENELFSIRVYHFSFLNANRVWNFILALLRRLLSLPSCWIRQRWSWFFALEYQKVLHVSFGNVSSLNWSVPLFLSAEMVVEHLFIVWSLRSVCYALAIKHLSYCKKRNKKKPKNDDDSLEHESLTEHMFTHLRRSNWHSLEYS